MSHLAHCLFFFLFLFFKQKDNKNIFPAFNDSWCNISHRFVSFLLNQHFSFVHFSLFFGLFCTPLEI